MYFYQPILGSVLVISAGAVHAQASSFNGAFGQLGIGYEQSSPSSVSSSAAFNGYSIPANSTMGNSNYLIGTGSVGYYADVAKGYLLGVGAEYTLGGSAQNYTESGSIRGTTYSSGNYYYQKNYSYNIFLSPAMVVGTNGLAYLKAGYSGAQYKQFTSLSSNYTGYSLGLGYKQIISGGMYGFGEVNYANYGNQTVSTSARVNTGATGTGAIDTLTASGTNGMSTLNFLVGVGYKF